MVRGETCGAVERFVIDSGVLISNIFTKLIEATCCAQNVKLFRYPWPITRWDHGDILQISSEIVFYKP